MFQPATGVVVNSMIMGAGGDGDAGVYFFETDERWRTGTP